ncbi:hypothetical protein [Clostridium muellerianum]|uniref:hypothetical protein n=1 Tax=Clostridium muellerianum TaxID=2716538 RepID=UPI001FAD1032|nr:hypothetical protein [Clostridium muellerianum]
MLKIINSITKRELVEVIPKIDLDFMRKVVKRDYVHDYIMKYGKNKELKELLKSY